MFGLGFGEIVLIAIVALIFLGPQRLPGIAQQFARAIREVRHATDTVRQNVEDATAEPVEEIRQLATETKETTSPTSSSENLAQ